MSKKYIALLVDQNLNNHCSACLRSSGDRRVSGLRQADGLAVQNATFSCSPGVYIFLNAGVAILVLILDASNDACLDADHLTIRSANVARYHPPHSVFSYQSHIVPTASFRALDRHCERSFT